MATITVKVSSKADAWARMTKANLDNALRSAGDTVLQRAQLLAPVATGALKRDGRVEKSSGEVKVKFGDATVPYARKRHYENNKNPQTLLYLERAGDQVAKEGIKRYLR